MSSATVRVCLVIARRELTNAEQTEKLAGYAVDHCHLYSLEKDLVRAANALAEAARETAFWVQIVKELESE